MYNKVKKPAGVPLDSKTNKIVNVSTSYLCKETNQEVNIENT
jgi:hypothetical protein